MFMVYKKRINEKRAKGDGFSTDDFERAKEIAHRERLSWWGQNGVYQWIKIKDLKTRKYIYEA